ncbi:LysM peptidoglycan-binding domain-containing protein [Lactococcus insecticola]|uniref:LysM peptidoglycan-binding domain-containing protein n=1 Tax=Pseudolactococcus insecticola TaxID=2709158 RepID=A0A6A0B7J7_9LACT|nr:LysM peptidoglycan-binding domain-containing protein [Lactococcus insecticola]GFH40448.1 hypothetical protein Hs20B_08460 [Lactococcus insecticola]
MGKHDPIITRKSNQTALKLALGAGTFAGALALANTADADTYTVKSGDSLWAIAQKYHTTVANLATINKLSNASMIFVGQKIETSNVTTTPSTPVTPTPAAPSAPAATATTYIVKSGDTLGAIAQRHGVSVASIVQNSGLSNPNLIFVGQKLIIKAGSATPTTPSPSPAAPAPVAPSQTAAVYHTVKSGETLGAIAQKYGVSVAVIVKNTGLSNPNLIFVGQKLTIKAAANVENTGGGSTASDNSSVGVPLDVYSGPYTTRNTYAAGNCTWYVKDVFKTRMGDYWGNAKDWAASAKREGVPVDGNPVANLTIAVFPPGSAGADKTYGHVAVVIAVNGDYVTIKEMNAVGYNKVSTRVVAKSAASYIHMNY